MGRNPKKNKWLSDNKKAALLRWWLAGMCYFFIGFGTQAGMFRDPVDLIFFLGAGIGIVTVVIYNPVAYGMFDIVRNKRITNKAYYERKGWENARYRLWEIFKSIGLTALVYFTYQNVNLLIVSIRQLPEQTIVIPGEPFGFATLYVVYYYMLQGVADTIRRSAGDHGGPKSGETGIYR